MTVMNDIYHFGIKGMKWGIRRYQNRDGSLTAAGKTRYYEDSKKEIIKNSDGSKTIPKGFVFNRVGKESMDINKSGALYVSYGKQDVSRYIKSLGPTSIGKLLGTSSNTVQHIRVNKNLKVPSDETTAKEVSKILLKDKKMLKTFNDSIYSMVVLDNPYSNITEKDLAEAIRNPSGKKAQKISYGVSSFLADPNFSNDAKTIYSRFREQGYDAVPDMHDKLSGTSSDPIIVINPDRLTITSTTYITKDVMKNAKEYVKSLNKLKVSDLIK